MVKHSGPKGEKAFATDKMDISQNIKVLDEREFKEPFDIFVYDVEKMKTGDVVVEAVKIKTMGDICRLADNPKYRAFGGLEFGLIAVIMRQCKMFKEK